MKPEESFVGQSIRSLQTMLRLLSRDDGRYLSVVPDGIYGPQTQQAVARFQKLSGLPADGITDQATWQQIAAAYRGALVRVGKAEPIEILLEPGQVLRAGEESPYLYLMQSMLIFLAEEEPALIRPDHTGVLDGKSQQALSAFQALAGLPQTGQLDRLTWQQLSRHFTLHAHRYHGVYRREPE